MNRAFCTASRIFLFTLLALSLPCARFAQAINFGTSDEDSPAPQPKTGSKKPSASSSSALYLRCVYRGDIFNGGGSRPFSGEPTFRIDFRGESRDITLNRPLSIEQFSTEQIKASYHSDSAPISINYEYTINRMTGGIEVHGYGRDEVLGRWHVNASGHCSRIQASEF